MALMKQEHLCGVNRTSLHLNKKETTQRGKNSTGGIDFQTTEMSSLLSSKEHCHGNGL